MASLILSIIQAILIIGLATIAAGIGVGIFMLLNYNIQTRRSHS